MDPETRRDTWDILLVIKFNSIFSKDVSMFYNMLHISSINIFLQKLRGEKTILISTHNMEEADILGDRIAILHAGHLRSYGTAMFLKKQYGMMLLRLLIFKQNI